MSSDGLIRFLYVSGCQKRGSVSPFRGPGSISHSAGNELKRHEVSNSLSIPNYEKHKRIFLLCLPQLNNYGKMNLHTREGTE